MEQGVLKGLEPEKVFTYFEQICQIPHGSYHVEELSNFLVTWAKDRNLYVEQDNEYNVLIKKPASPGMEKAPTIILQGHMDMVCEKNQDIDHDFLTEGLQLIRTEDDITANGTTLGGDDGIAVAYAMAILEDSTLQLPALEVVITTQEEVGMEGAFAFDVSRLTGNYLINLDSEEEGCVLTSCAGGATLTVSYPVTLTQPSGIPVAVCIRGLLGGHSGADIHLHRANANILAIQFLTYLQSCSFPVQIARITGGNKTNAIAREATILLYIPENMQEALQKAVSHFFSQTSKIYQNTEPNMTMFLESCIDSSSHVITLDSISPFLKDFKDIPDGVYKMSPDMENMVETSSNLGVLNLTDFAIECGFLLRSSKEQELDHLLSIIQKKLATEKKTLTITDRYPGWEYRKHSKLRDLVVDAYAKQYQKPMRIEGIHAGLECGIFASRKDLDIISIGPDILDIHTPKETLKIASTQRTYELLITVLQRAKELL